MNSPLFGAAVNMLVAKKTKVAFKSKPCQYITNHPGKLGLLSLWG